jgi:hypothetical protein
MIAAAGNNFISDSNPNQYLPECATKLGEDADDVFASNLLPRPSSFDYSTEGYYRFLEMRASLVAAFVRDLCEGKAA